MPTSITYSNPLGLPQGQVIVVSRVFTDEFTNSSPIPYLNGGIMSKMKAIINFYTFLGFENQDLIFAASGNTITNNTTGSVYDFVEEGWRVGMTLTVSGTSSNNGSYTITNIASLVITVASGLANETATNASIYDDTPITALDFYYNLIGNGEPVSYLSKTDAGAIQRFTVSSLDATDTTTHKNCIAASSSYGWVTNVIDTNGLTSEVYVVGNGISGHRQNFILTQTFSVAPFWIRGQYNNFLNKNAPYYFNNTSLKHIFQLDAKFTASNPNVPYSGGITTENGLSDWFNANNISTIPEYTCTSIQYHELGSGALLPALDLSKNVRVSVNVNSRSGLFQQTLPTGTNTVFVLDFLYNSLDSSDYTGTETTLRQNLKNDRLRFAANGGGNGEYYGTPYQVITNVSIGFGVDNVQIIFDVVFSPEILALLKSKANNNRNYSIIVTTQNIDITGTEQSDRVPILCDFNNCTYDQNDASLVLSSGYKCYNFPDTDTPQNCLVGYEGEPALIQFPFTLRYDEENGISPMLQSCSIQIVASKTGEPDFVLEGQNFNTTFIRKLFGIQDIDIVQSRGFNSYDGDPFNTVSLVRDASLDNVIAGKNYAGYLFTYTSILRYEYWLNIIQQSQEGSFPIFSDIDNITNAWKTLQSNGWSINAKFSANVLGYDGWVTNLYNYTPINVTPIGTAPIPIPHFTVTQELFDINLNSVPSIVKGNKTLILTTFTGDWSVLPDGFDGLYGYLFIDVLNGIVSNGRRFASSEFDSESDNPFEAAIPDSAATSFRSTRNLTINFYNYTSITVASWYDDTILNLTNNNTNMYIGCKVGLLANDYAMAFEDDSLMAFEDTTIMEYEQ